MFCRPSNLPKKIVQTKDIQELVPMQTEFLRSQMRALSEQVKDLSETVSKAASDGKKTFVRGSTDEGRAGYPRCTKSSSKAA